MNATVYCLARIQHSAPVAHDWRACLQAHIECELTIEEETKDTCRQTLEGDVNIHIFGLGKIAENIIADNLKKVYSGIPQIVERCVAEGAAALRSLVAYDVQMCNH